MADKFFIPLAEYSDIPSIFYSDLTGKPFETCIHCDIDLINSGVNYIIEKAFIQTLPYLVKNTIFEYAMCLNCWEKVRKNLSVVSLNNLQEFFQKKVDFKLRNKELHSKEDNLNIDNWISNCIINNSAMNEAKEFQLACHCIGDQIIYDQLPYMLSGEAADELIELISNQTLGEMDDFKDKLIRPSPDLEELFNKKKLLVL